MGIFDKKAKIDYQTFYRNYYDSQIFHLVVDGEDRT